MSSPPIGPAKAKKKKRSFLDEDDFFNMKKARPRSPAKLAAPSLGPNTNQPEIQLAPKQENALFCAETFSGDENGAVFHSANASFADSDHPLSPVAMVHKLANLSSNSPNFYSNKNPGVDPTVCGVYLSSGFPGENAPKQETESPITSELSIGALGPLSSMDPVSVSVSVSVSDQEEDEDEDDEDVDLKEFFKGLAKKKADLGDEHDRLYLVKVTSRLGRPFECEKQITGETSFAELTELLLRDTLRDFKDVQYWKHGVLVWIEGKSELKPIFKPKTLRIPEPLAGTPTKISCLYIPVEHVTSFETLYPEFQQVLAAEAELEEEDANNLGVLLGNPENNTTNGGNPLEKEEKSEYFVIGLKGKDNKRIEAEVGPSTKIRSVLNYYMQAKGLVAKPGCEGRILFEDEELDLDAVVGDTELEEDFEVQVYI